MPEAQSFTSEQLGKSMYSTMPLEFKIHRDGAKIDKYLRYSSALDMLVLLKFSPC